MTGILKTIGIVWLLSAALAALAFYSDPETCIKVFSALKGM